MAINSYKAGEKLRVLAVLVFVTCHLPVASPSCHNLPFPDRCSCSETLLNCTNSGFTNVKQLSNLVEKFPLVKEIIFKGNSIQSLPENIFGRCTDSSSKLENLKKIDLSQNEITHILGKTFHCIPNVEQLDLSNNMWYVDPNKGRVFSNLQTLKTLYLNNAFGSGKVSAHSINLTYIFSASNMTQLEELHLENNAISRVPPNTFCYLQNLKRLYLSNNVIYNVELNATCLVKLEELYLSHNTIPALTHDSMAQLNMMATVGALRVVHLQGNEFMCDCHGDMPEFMRWIQSDQSGMIVNKETLMCVNHMPIDMTQTAVVNLSQDDLDRVCSAYDYPDHAKTAAIVIGILFAFVGVALIVCAYVHRSKLRQKCGPWLDPFTKLSFGRAQQQGYSSVTI